MNNSPDRTRGMVQILSDTVDQNTDVLVSSAGITTIDRRPGRPSFHHMGPLPDIPPTMRQPETKHRVSTLQYKMISIKYIIIHLNCLFSYLK